MTAARSLRQPSRSGLAGHGPEWMQLAGSAGRDDRVVMALMGGSEHLVGGGHAMSLPLGTVSEEPRPDPPRPAARTDPWPAPRRAASPGARGGRAGALRRWRRRAVLLRRSSALVTAPPRAPVALVSAGAVAAAAPRARPRPSSAQSLAGCATGRRLSAAAGPPRRASAGRRRRPGPAPAR